MQFDRKTVRILAGLTAFGVLLNYSLQHFTILQQSFAWLMSLLSPFLLGGCIAFILNVPMRFLERTLFPGRALLQMSGKKGLPPAAGRALRLLDRLKRPISLILTLALMAAVVFIVIFLMVPELAQTFSTLQKVAPVFWAEVQKLADQLVAQYPEAADLLTSFRLNWQELAQTIFDFIKDSGIFSSAFGAASSLVSGIVSFFLGLVFALYLLLQKERLGLHIRKVLYAFLPRAKVDWTLRVASLSSDTFSRFLSGQCLEALILGSMFFLAMTVLRFPYALLIGVLVAFTALIPIFGAFLGCAVGTFLILMVDPVKALWFIVLFLVLQQLEGNFIYPRVVGSTVGLPSIWVLAAVTLGGSLMGIAGMLLFIPLCSVLYTLLRETVARRLRERKISVR